MGKSLEELWVEATDEEKAECFRGLLKQMGPSSFYEMLCGIWGQEAVDKGLDERPEVKKYYLELLRVEREKGHMA